MPSLLELLGERRRMADRRSLADHAAEALRALGHGRDVRAFHRALEGDPEELTAVSGEHRDAVVSALMKVVDSAEFGRRSPWTDGLAPRR